MIEEYQPKGRIKKSKLCKMYDFCPSDLAKFLNHEKFNELEPLGYTKNSRYISARIVQKIIEILGPPNVK